MIKNNDNKDLKSINVEKRMDYLIIFIKEVKFIVKFQYNHELHSK